MPERSPEQRRPGLMIEGEPIEAMEEIEIDRARPLDLPNTIKWPGCRLEFVSLPQPYSLRLGFDEEETPFLLYTGRLVFRNAQGVNETIDLSNETTSRPTVFTGSRRGFFAHDPRVKGRTEKFFLVGVEPDTLQRDQRRLVSVYHELGHTQIYDRNEDTRLAQAAAQQDPTLLPQRVGIQPYYEELMTAQDSHDKVRGMSLFHERYAWANGFRLAHETGAPLGFHESTSAMQYAKYCLQSYARYHSDKRFVTGLGKPKP